MRAEHIAVQRLIRLWPFPRGAGRIVDTFFSKLTFREDVAVAWTTDGFNMKVLPNENMGRYLYFTGEFGRDIVEVLCTFSEPGDVLLDIGANVGYISCVFSIILAIRES